MKRSMTRHDARGQRNDSKYCGKIRMPMMKPTQYIACKNSMLNVEIESSHDDDKHPNA